MLFFPRDNSLISRGNSHVSRVRGLVVRCLLFNPEVSCSNPWVCATFFTSIPKQKVLTFFGTMRLFGFVRLFFSKFFNVPKASSFHFFDILQQNECYKILKGPFRVPNAFFRIFGTMRLNGNFEKIRKIFSQFLVLKDLFLKDRSFFYAAFLKCFHRSPCSIFTRNETFCEMTPQGFATYRRPSKCSRKILNFFSSIFCLRFSVEKEWVFCCFQLGKNGFRGLRVSLRVFLAL